MKKIFLLFIFVQSFSILLSAQSGIFGKVTDEKSSEELIAANLLLEKNGVFIKGTITDFDGNYLVLLDPGTYTLKLSYTGYAEKLIENIVVKTGEMTKVDVQLDEGVALEEVIVKEYKVPHLSMDCTTSGATITSISGSAIKASGARRNTVIDTRKKTAIPSSAVTVRGSRAEATDYHIDGIRVKSEIVSKKDIFLGGTEAAFNELIFNEKESDALLEELPEFPETTKESDVEAGILTAGEWNGLVAWDYWKGLLKKEDRQHQQLWRLFPKERYSVKVTNLAGFGLADCTVKLLDKNEKTVWQAKTDNQGKAELWSNIFGGEATDFKIVASYKDQSSKPVKAVSFNKKINAIELPVDCEVLKNLDIAFVVDATGSMRDEINYLKAELRDVIGQVKEQNKNLNIRTSSVFYRDTKDEYLTRNSIFSNNISQTIGFISNQSAAGGGDFPEAVDAALEDALKMEWRKTAVARILFLVLDAPPHDSAKETIQKQIKRAAEMGIRIIPIAASGVNQSTEFLMKSLAIATNGTYVFITDHSGVGNPHLEATVNEFNVEMLNDLMVRLISEFSEQENCNPEQQQNRIEVAEGVDPASPTAGYLNQMIYFYPNPAEDIVFVELKENFSQINLLNIVGKTVRTINFPDAGVSRIDVTELPAGAYLLQFIKGADIITKKLIVAKP